MDICSVLGSRHGVSEVTQRKAETERGLRTASHVMPVAKGQPDQMGEQETTGGKTGDASEIKKRRKKKHPTNGVSWDKGDSLHICKILGRYSYRARDGIQRKAG